MINFEYVAKKIENVLNGVDAEITALGFTNPTDLRYMVETQGFHLDHIMDENIGVNFIPVFISSMGGQINPVPDLKQGNYNVPITFYFPVRFKNKMYALYEYLGDCFIGRYLDYGYETGSDHVAIKCVSNISVPTFGEIQDLDLKEFKTWVDNKYNQKIEVMEPFITMTVNLYLSNMASGFLWANQVKASLLLMSPTTQTIEDKFYPVVFASASATSNSQPVSEQEIGKKMSTSLPSVTAYGSSFTVYMDDSPLFQYILGCWCSGEIQEVRVMLSLEFTTGKSIIKKCMIDSVNIPIVKGDPLTMTFSFTPSSD